MELIAGNDSGSLEGCVRVWVEGDDVLVQVYREDPARIAPCSIPDGEVFGRMPRAVFMEAARKLMGAG
ncbi:MAG: hypothetical protein ACRDZ4_10025 [Egibacteraceae bacterium]